MKNKNILAIFSVAVISFSFIGCKGKTGSTGATGPMGPDGIAGPGSTQTVYEGTLPTPIVGTITHSISAPEVTIDSFYDVRISSDALHWQGAPYTMSLNLNLKTIDIAISTYYQGWFYRAIVQNPI